MIIVYRSSIVIVSLVLESTCYNVYMKHYYANTDINIIIIYYVIMYNL